MQFFMGNIRMRTTSTSSNFFFGKIEMGSQPVLVRLFLSIVDCDIEGFFLIGCPGLI